MKGNGNQKKEKAEVWSPGQPLTAEDEKLLDTVREVAKKLGRTPTKQECPNVQLLKRRFRTWKNVIIAAQLPDLHSENQVEIREKEKGENYKLKIVVVAVSTSAIFGLAEYEQEFQKKYGNNLLDLKVYYVANRDEMRASEREQMIRDIQSADAAVIDLMGSAARIVNPVSKALDACKGQRIVIGNICRDKIRLGSFQMGSGQMKRKNDGEKRDIVAMMNKMRRMAVTAGTVLPFGITKDMKNLFLLIDYWQQATGEDIHSFMNLLLRDYFGMKKLPKETPCTMKKGIFLRDPFTGESFEKRKDYGAHAGFQPDRQIVAVLYYGHHYPNYVEPVIQKAVRGLSQFANVLPIAFSQNEDKDLEKLRRLLLEDEGVDLIINFMPFRLGAGPMGGLAERAVEILKEVNVPYMSPFYITKETREEWENSKSGINAGEFLISIMLPEMDGAICTIPVGVLDPMTESAPFGQKIDEINVINERMARLCGNVENYLKLRRLKNEDKKIAIVGYNYPPGEGNLFRASFLDVFGSISVLWKALEKEGYQTKAMEAEELQKFFCGEALINDARWSDPGNHMIYYRPSEHVSSEEVERCWGRWPGSVMVDSRGFRIPGLLSDHIFIGVQPSRSADVDDEESYHDQQKPLHHQYVAFYRWLREEFKADAIIHVGTHGTLEFLPGRSNGMSGSCWPDRLIGNLPHFYYYYCGNPSEAVVAKRRTYAQLVSYAPPAFTAGGLYGEEQQLYEMIAEYAESRQVAPERSRDLEKEIRKLAAKLELPKEIPELERELVRRKEALIPGGMHLLGQSYSRQEALTYAVQLMNFHREEGSPAVTEEMLDAYIGGKAAPENQEAWYLLGRKAFEQSQKNEEVEGMLRALQGAYLPVRPGGDVFRNAEQFPMGSNMVQFDPRLIPTPAAVRRGEKAARNTLEHYYKQTGAYPRSTAVILWGLETSRSQGETIGQIMDYLGIRRKESNSKFEGGFEVIPASELQHPRIDVIIHICGFFRDMFPNIMKDLNRVLLDLAQLDEPEEVNYFAGNARKLEQALLAKGYSPEDARELSLCRIFGPAESEYGTRLTDLIRHGQWTEEEELSLAFTDSLSYVYTEHYQGKSFENLLQMNYNIVELISQIRNNVEYEMIDLDHYYEFYGGLSKSIERTKGKKAAMYVTDTTASDVQTEEFSTSVQRGIHTRLMNPKWIEGMLHTSYHGVQKLADRFENVLGMAATTGEIKESVFHRLEEIYVRDQDMAKRLREDNPHSYLSMVERLMEAHQRGYWNADSRELQELRNEYLRIQQCIEQ